jgi:hypothetical protein
MLSRYLTIVSHDFRYNPFTGSEPHLTVLSTVSGKEQKVSLSGARAMDAAKLLYAEERRKHP